VLFATDFSRERLAAWGVQRPKSGDLLRAPSAPLVQMDHFFDVLERLCIGRRSVELEQPP
jgi:hypothetical protein